MDKKVYTKKGVMSLFYALWRIFGKSSNLFIYSEAITNSGIKYDEDDEAVNVCKAIQEMRKESEQKKAIEIARNFYNLGVDVEKISQGVGYAVETVKEWLGLFDDADEM